MCSIIKLSNGETLLAKIISSDDEHLCVNDPVMLNSITVSNHNTVSTTTWVPLNGPTTLVARKQNHVVATANVEEEMSLFYRKSVAIIKNDAAELEQIVDEIRRQVEEHEEEKYLLKNQPPVTPRPASSEEEVKNKLFLIRARAANTVH